MFAPPDRPAGDSSAESSPPAEPASAVDQGPGPPVDKSVEGAESPPRAELVGVLDDLEEIRKIDHHAQQQLLESLKQADPVVWPLMVRQFRAALKYREDLPTDVAPSSRGKRSRGGKTDEGGEPLSNWQTAAGRALTDEDSPESSRSEVHEVTDRLLDPDDVPTDMVAAEAFSQEVPQVEQPPAAAQDEQEVMRAVFESTSDDVPEEPAPWHGKDEATQLRASRNDPHRSPSELNWEQHLAAAIERLATSAVDTPDSNSEVLNHTRLRLLQLASGESDAAMAPIPNLSTTEQEYWTKQLFALATYTNDSSNLDRQRRAAVAAGHLEDALDQLRRLGSLKVHNLAFCQKVYDFGAYDPFDNNRFAAGRQVTLYAEVENYRSQSTEKGFHTSFASSYEIVDSLGNRITGDQFPEVKDYCRNRRRDFHIQYTLPLPENARPGSYRLKLTIEDKLGEKQGRNAIDFQIVDGSGSSDR